eukprot:CAMPEP_0182573106 /NCGR_PEP_ID=MMETSP1324-20130603/18219_1 /TAXON_ID=236786 /ORGANISM="Florenciella sp., Strain RCC1587" /LENGTH=67 /DNA_ID=CAMNT_0024788149 /DNA_START=84 /DNA_END=287 /DNA_ORIENTATION=-
MGVVTWRRGRPCSCSALLTEAPHALAHAAKQAPSHFTSTPDEAPSLTSLDPAGANMSDQPASVARAF